jgi:NAD(P)-dependent dehydrogenase (short-subunit alcohol dehydrogenase family)
LREAVRPRGCNPPRGRARPRALGPGRARDRRAGIGFAIARRLLGLGASVLAHSWSPHDARQPWGADPGGVEAVLAELRLASGQHLAPARELA